MSKPVRKHKRSRKRIEPHKHKVSAPARRGGSWPSTAKLQSIKPFVPFIIIAILAAIPFCMGKYFEFNSPGAFDSGAYVYSAHAKRNRRQNCYYDERYEWFDAL